MNGAFYVGAIGLDAQQRALDEIANNISNVNTTAFKRSEIRFSQLIASRSDPNSMNASLGVDAFTMAGVTANPLAMINQPGRVEATGNSLDLAIEGDGFIEVMGPEGNTLLWRGGTMKVGEDGLLATQQGYALKAAITVPSDASNIQIGADGIVRARTGVDGDPVEIGQIMLVKISDPTQVEPLDGGFYKIDETAVLVDAQPGEDGVGTLVQGSLERSNVELTTEMVELLLVQRAYAANAQVVQAADQLMGIANGLRR